MYDTNSRDTRCRSRNRSGSRERRRTAEQQEVGQQLQMISLTRWPPTPTPLAFVLRLVIYFINNKMLSATRRGGEEIGEESGSRLHAAQAVGYCVPEGGTDMATWCSMQRRQVAGPVRWAYCAKKKINCVRTHNRAMNQNHTSWLYIDIRLANECQPPPPALFLSGCHLWPMCAMQMQNGSKPVVGHAPIRRSPATHNWSHK